MSEQATIRLTIELPEWKVLNNGLSHVLDGAYLHGDDVIVPGAREGEWHARGIFDPPPSNGTWERIE